MANPEFQFGGRFYDPDSCARTMRGFLTSRPDKKAPDVMDGFETRAFTRLCYVRLGIASDLDHLGYWHDYHFLWPARGMKDLPTPDRNRADAAIASMKKNSAEIFASLRTQGENAACEGRADNSMASHANQLAVTND